MPIPLSRPPVDEEVKKAVLAAVESGQYILGPECKAFEKEFAAYNGAKHAVLTTNATAALWMLIKAFGAQAGDEILVPSHTAFPTIEAICFAGVTPVFVDIDETYTVDVRDAAAKVTPRTVGFIPVHLYGHPANLPAIQELCAKHKLWLLEDCAQAHGAEWQGRKVGSFGRAAAFSFYPSKNLTVMGDGGLLVTEDDEVAARCRRLRDHGRQNKDIHVEIGFNLRFNDIQAAVVVAVEESYAAAGRVDDIVCFGRGNMRNPEAHLFGNIFKNRHWWQTAAVLLDRRGKLGQRHTGHAGLLARGLCIGAGR